MLSTDSLRYAAIIKVKPAAPTQLGTLLGDIIAGIDELDGYKCMLITELERLQRVKTMKKKNKRSKNLVKTEKISAKDNSLRKAKRT